MMNNLYTKRNNKIKKLWLLSSFLSIVVSLVMYVITNESHSYELLFLLPLFFGLVNFASITLYYNFYRSIVCIILVGGYFIKMVISPLFFAMGGYHSFFLGYSNIENINLAIGFMIFEYMLIVAFAILFFKGKHHHCKEVPITRSSYSGTKKMLLGLVILIAFLVFAYNYVPAIKKLYFFITDIRIEDMVGLRWDNDTVVARGSIQRYIYSLFMFLWPIVRFVLPATLIHYNYTKRGTTRRGLILSSFCVFIPFILLGGDNLAPFVAASFALLVIIKLYEEKGKRIVKFFMIIGTIALISIVIGKLTALTMWRGATGITNIAQLLNAYFPGFDNVALAIKMDEPSKLTTMFYDIYSGIPFAGTIFGLSGQTLNDIFVQTVRTGGQIVPWGCNIGYYFSYLFSPIISGFFIIYILKREQCSRLTSNFWVYFSNMIFSTYTAVSIILYSTQIYIRFIWNVMLPILVFMWIAGAKSKTFNSYEENV